MRTLCLFLALAAAGTLAAPVLADETLHLKCDSATAANLHAWAVDALNKRKYKIESDTPELLVGSIDKNRVEIAIAPQSVVIRWQGEPGKHEYWLRNLKSDILYSLAE